MEVWEDGRMSGGEDGWKEECEWVNGWVNGGRRKDEWIHG